MIVHWERIEDETGIRYEAQFGRKLWRVRPLSDGRWVARWKPVRNHREWRNLSAKALNCVGGTMRTGGKRPRMAWYRSADAAMFAVEQREEDERVLREKRKGA